MENKRIGKVTAIAIALILVFLIGACFKLQMELNELREKHDALSAEVDDARIELDRRLEEKERLENNPDEYFEDKAYEQGYRKPTDSVYINDMPAE